MRSSQREKEKIFIISLFLTCQTWKRNKRQTWREWGKSQTSPSENCSYSIILKSDFLLCQRGVWKRSVVSVNLTFEFWSLAIIAFVLLANEQISVKIWFIWVMLLSYTHDLRTSFTVKFNFRADLSVLMEF